MSASITCAKQSLGRRLTTGLSSPRSESRSASAMAYAGTGSRFFTRILAVSLHGGTNTPLGHVLTRSHTHGTYTDVNDTVRTSDGDARAEWYGDRAGAPSLPWLRPKASTSQRIKPRDQTDICVIRSARRFILFYSSYKM